MVEVEVASRVFCVWLLSQSQPGKLMHTRSMHSTAVLERVPATKRVEQAVSLSSQFAEIRTNVIQD